MIEQIHGTGPSGVTGKATSQGKNSLFATLMGILEKHAQGSGKGLSQLSLQQRATLSGENQTGRSKLLFAMSGERDTLAEKIHDQFLALTTKGKHKKKKADDTAIPFVANHVINDLATPVTKATKTALGNAAKTTSVFSSGQIHGQNKQTSPDGQTQNRIQLPLQNQALHASSKSESSASVKGKPSVHLQNTVLPVSARTTVSTNSAARLAQTSQVADNNKTGVPASAPASVEQGLAGATRQMMSNSTDHQSTTAYSDSMTKAAVKTKHISANASSIAGTKHISANTASVAGTEAKSKHISANAANIQSTAETTLEETPVVHSQQNKTVQPQQLQSATTSSAALSAGVVISDRSDASLADSGSQSQGKGNQDGRYISALGNDTKAGSTSSSSGTHFHQYMSGKATPSMSLFDSMQHIAQSASKGKTNLEIQLEPANLGKIQISLQSDAAKHLQIHMIVDQSTTRAALEQQLPQLKSALAQQGFDLSGFSMGSQGQQSASGDNNRGKTHHFAGTADHGIDEATPVNRQQATATASGLSIRV